MATNNWYLISLITYIWVHDPCTHIWWIPIIFSRAVLKIFERNVDKWGPWWKHSRPSVHKQINIKRHVWLNLHLKKFIQKARKGQCEDKRSLAMVPVALHWEDLWLLARPCSVSTSWLEWNNMQSKKNLTRAIKYNKSAVQWSLQH